MASCDICEKEKQEWELYKYWGGVNYCKSCVEPKQDVGDKG